jgi:sugar lactone lactonase YvrE
VNIKSEKNTLTTFSMIEQNTIQTSNLHETAVDRTHFLFPAGGAFFPAPNSMAAVARLLGWCGVAVIAVWFLPGQTANAAGIPWTNGQPVEHWITGFSPSSASDAVAVDGLHNKLYVTDRSRHRVLRFAYPLTADLTTNNAEMEFGQSDLSGSLPNRGGNPAANTLNQPYGLTVGLNGDLWVSDQQNNRILRYVSPWTAANGPAASTVLGQAGFTTQAAGSSATGLYYPCGLSVDSAGNLWVGDVDNHRVLRFANAAGKANGAAADGVLGQANFSGNSPNRGGSAAANTFSSPYLLCASGTTLWVSEYGNSRVLRFATAASKANGANADGVLGQSDFTSAASNRGGSIAANTLSYPSGVTVDASGRLYVSDFFNGRVLIFADAANKANGAAADNVLFDNNFTSSGNAGSAWGLVYDDTYHRLVAGNVFYNVAQFFNCYYTSTTLAGSPNPCTTVGAPVTFTGTVTTANSGPVASGNVTFIEGTNVLGAAALDGSGQATFTTTALSDGNHYIVAEFTNSATHAGSVSTQFLQIIGKYTSTLSLASSVNPSPVKSLVTFTAAVTTAATGAPTPTGAVQFLVDSNLLATVTLAGNGSASWATSGLTEGPHSIMAIYGGDANFRAATNTFEQTVNPEGLYTLAPVANVERDTDGVTPVVYDGNYYGGYLYEGAFAGTSGITAFKFDLSGLSGTIARATLKLRIADIYLDGTVAEVHAHLYTSADDAWTDIGTPTAPTSTNLPSLATWALSTLTINDWVTNDVTAFVQGEHSGNQSASFVFDTDAPISSFNYLAFYAKEYSLAGYAPVLEVQMVTLTQTNQAPLVFTPTSPQAYGTTNPLSVTGGAGTGAISYTVMSGPGQIVAGNQLVVTAGSGTVTVVAAKAADTNNFAAYATNIVAAVEADQTITFAPLGAQLATNTVALSATASSGLPVSFTLLGGPGQIIGGSLSFTGPGQVTLVAAQSGDANWNAAPSITNRFNVLGVYNLTIISPHGIGQPAPGVYPFVEGSLVTNLISASDTQGTTQYLSAGWILSGLAPSTGPGTNTVVVITNSATLTWLWSTNYWLHIATNGSGTVNAADNWIAAKSVVVLTATPASGDMLFTLWTGDVAADQATNNPLTLLLDSPKSVAANFSFKPKFSMEGLVHGSNYWDQIWTNRLTSQVMTQRVYEVIGNTWQFVGTSGHNYNLQTVYTLGHGEPWATLPGAANLPGGSAFVWTNLYGSTNQAQFFRFKELTD